MKMAFPSHARAVAPVVMIALAVGLFLSGCIGGCIRIPPIEFEVKLLSVRELPHLGPAAGMPIPADASVELPDICGFPTEEEIFDRLSQYVGERIARRARLARVLLYHLEFDAKEGGGDFSSLTRVGVWLVTGDKEILIGEAESPHGLGDNFLLEPETPIDLADALLNQSGNGCLHMKFTASGRVPSLAVRFDMKARFGLVFSL